MHKSLGDYNIEQSSSADIKNIKWSQRNPKDVDKKKKKRTKKIPSTNIIYTQKTKESVEKVFKVEDTEKSKKKKTGKRFQKSSASNCKIEQGFKRPWKVATILSNMFNFK